MSCILTNLLFCPKNVLKPLECVSFTYQVEVIRHALSLQIFLPVHYEFRHCSNNFDIKHFGFSRWSGLFLRLLNIVGDAYMVE
jgi:hypothetical protein